MVFQPQICMMRGAAIRASSIRRAAVRRRWCTIRLSFTPAMRQPRFHSLSKRCTGTVIQPRVKIRSSGCLPFPTSRSIAISRTHQDSRNDASFRVLGRVCVQMQPGFGRAHVAKLPHLERGNFPVTPAERVGRLEHGLERHVPTVAQRPVGLRQIVVLVELQRACAMRM